MAEPSPRLSRAEAIAILEDGQAQLDALFGRLDNQEMTQPQTIGGGDWSAKDLMGHIAFWEELALNAIDACRAGRRAAVDEFADAAAANAHNQRASANHSLADTRSRAAAAHSAIVSVLRTLSVAEWTSPPACEGATKSSLEELLGGILGAPNRPFGHAWAHLDDLRAYVER
jgi:hypothetical protein